MTRTDDDPRCYCPKCGGLLTAVTVALRGYCERHGWQWAEFKRHE